jgi:hypothetical protein
MAAAAVPAKASLVKVVAAMAVDALASGILERIAVTRFTACSEVRAGQAKAGACIVVENPACPAIGVVAATAVRTQPPLVLVLVAGAALLFGTGKPGVHMTGLAGGQGVQAEQRKGGEFVVKASTIPGFRRMATGTVFA